MRAVAETPDSMVGEVAGAGNVLLMSPPLTDGDGEACSSFLTAVPAERADVLSVTFNQSPDARLERWRTGNGPGDAANLGFVVVGDGVRSAAAAQPAGGGPELEAPGPTVLSVSSPGDLTGIGIKLGQLFDDWADDGNELLLCFHTLTTLLQYAEFKSVYEFVHVLTGQIRSRGGLAHYHLDPTAHDQRTVNRLQGLFDAVVEQDEAGAWEVKRRR